MGFSPVRPAQIQVLLDRLPRELSPQRLKHVFGVAHTTAMLAARHGFGPDLAMLAGLLHDLYKEWPPERLKQEIERRGGVIAPDDAAFPRVWHGQAAALFGRDELGIEDPDVFEAVMLHTTADARVAPLTRALFTADFCEPGRRTEAAGRVFEAACRDLDEGFRQALHAKTLHMQQHGKRLSPRAIRALLHYLPPESAVELAIAET